jgi:uncharacterized protein (TIGR01777 family)
MSMHILIAGGTGFIGKYLINALAKRGDTITVLTRDAQSTASLEGLPVRLQKWDGKSAGPWCDIINEVDTVVNLAGVSIAGGRWNDERKKAMVDSRVNATRALVDAIGQASHKPSVFVSASAVGYYGNVPEGECTESAKSGSDFLATLCIRWEGEAIRAEEHGVRTVCVRTGLVLAADGGALKPMLLPFKMGAGGPMGSGNQWWPWIHVDDEIGLIVHAIDNHSVRGPMNLTAPVPVRMNELAKALGNALHRPSLIPTPGFALRLLLGEMADALILSGQRAVPTIARATGYKFKYATVEEAMKALFG